MRTSFLISGCVAIVLAATTASAQTPVPAPAPGARTDIAPKVEAGQWRSSKLIGWAIRPLFQPNACVAGGFRPGSTQCAVGRGDGGAARAAFIADRGCHHRA